jgi:acetyltransferase-like isoleucine patch superfamily enzyme
MLKRSCRLLIGTFAACHAMWHVIRYRLLARAGMITFQQASEAISRVPLLYGYRVRQLFYRSLLESCGDRLEMNYGSTIGERESHIGSDVWIGACSYIDLADLGDQVLIAPHVCILAGGRHHRMDRWDLPIRLQGNNSLQRTFIGSGAWIGANAVIMADVGEGAVVGAGSVVTKPVPPYAVVAGNPAQVIRYRTGGPPRPAAELWSPKAAEL